MIKRDAEDRLRYLVSKFKAVALTGPRQAGKTTLVKTLFPDKAYVSLENLTTRKYALSDPEGFLADYPNGAILDEAQQVPDLFSYLQEILDNTKKKGLFILTGSNNFLLNQAITQSLAGRVAYMTLLPFSLAELARAKKLPAKDNDFMLKGCFPPVYQQRLRPEDWYVDYTYTYLQRDVRQLKNVTELNQFERFLSLLAGRCGQELNLTALGNEAGVDHKTAQSWIGVLGASFIIHVLPAHYRNFNKTVVKRPKVYFCDTGLLCSLLRITNTVQLASHPLRGSIFENMVVTELIKNRTNKGQRVDLYYWRDRSGYEVDIIADLGTKLFPIEIKSGRSIASDYFKNLEYWMNLSKAKSGALLYAGNQAQKRSNGITVSNWRTAIVDM